VRACRLALARAVTGAPLGPAAAAPVSPSSSRRRRGAPAPSWRQALAGQHGMAVLGLCLTRWLLRSASDHAFGCPPTHGHGRSGHTLPRPRQPAKDAQKRPPQTTTLGCISTWHPLHVLRPALLNRMQRRHRARAALPAHVACASCTASQGVAADSVHTGCLQLTRLARRQARGLAAQPQLTVHISARPQGQPSGRQLGQHARGPWGLLAGAEGQYCTCALSGRQLTS